MVGWLWQATEEADVELAHGAGQAAAWPAGAAGQSPVGRILSAQARPSVRLARAGSTGAGDAGSRLGGRALVGKDFPWPRSRTGRPLSFVAQIRTTDVAHLAPFPLPPDTLLAFFYEANEQEGWGFDPDDRQFWRVVAVPIHRAVPAVPPAGALSFASHALTPRRVVTLPDLEEAPIGALSSPDRAAVVAGYEELERSTGHEPRHRMFGWPDLVQNPMQLECQLAANGVHVGGAGGHRNPSVAELRDGAADWLLLLQLDTDEGAGLEWGDTGRIYYWIRQQDLAGGRFDRVWMVLQSS